MQERIGQHLGNYEIRSLLGSGGFAEVYLAENRFLGTLVAIKVMKDQMSSQDVVGFIREARTIATLKHPNILRVLDFGIEPTPYIVLEYAAGGTLRQRHPTGTTVPLPTIASYVEQIAAALQYAHNQKQVHCDVKPENMLMQDDGAVVLSDFGLAVMIQNRTISRSAQDIVGTVTYMAPEQINGKAHPASDQYALAVVVYEWLCGARPFGGTTFIEIAIKHCTEPPLSLCSRLPALPEAVEWVVLKALAKEPQQRFESVEAFANALDQAIVANSISMTAPPPIDLAATAPTSKDLHVQGNTSPQIPPISISTNSVSIYDPMIPLQPAIPLVGRENDLARVKRRLASGGNVALTALNGLPGVGKTALAIGLAHDPELRAHFSDGILWAGLGPDPNITGLLSRWGSLLGMGTSEMASLKDSGAWARALRNAIGERKMLLVIDDAWKIEDALTFKVGGPNCAHLLTTRHRDIASHISFDGATEIEELSEEESMTLLHLLAPTVVEHDTIRVHDLVHAVGGLPLALTLMGNYLRKQAYSGQPRRVATALQRLTKPEERLTISEPHSPIENHPNLASDTHLSLQSVIAVTDQALPQEARNALYALSVFPPKPNSFSEEAALAVIDSDVDVLDVLLDAGLLEVNRLERYVLHQTVYDYAQLQLQGQGTAPQERLLSYVIAFVEAHKKDYEQLELESTIVLAALETAYQLKIQSRLVKAVIAFTPYMLLRGFYVLADRHLQRAYDVAVELADQYGMANALLYRGEIARKQGNFSLAEAHLKTSLGLARQIGDPERISAVLDTLGWVFLRRGQYAEAEEYLDEGLALARQIGHDEHICSLLKVLGVVALDQGHYTQSVKYMQEGLIIARQLENREQVGAMLINLGVAAARQGHYEEAESYYKEALVLARHIKHREQICVLLLNLGDVTTELEDYVQAELYLQEGLQLSRELEHYERISMNLSQLGRVMRKVRDYAQADLYLQESLALARQINSPYIICDTLDEYGNLQLDQHNIEAAEATFLEIHNNAPVNSYEALANYGLARVMFSKGNVSEACKLGEMSANALETIGYRDAKQVRAWLASIGS